MIIVLNITCCFIWGQIKNFQFTTTGVKKRTHILKYIIYAYSKSKLFKLKNN